MGSKIGRNAPCPCGSGKKHKHCCMVTISSKKLAIVNEMAKHQEGLIKFVFDNHQVEMAKRIANHLAKHPVEKSKSQAFANVAVCWEIFCSPIKEGKTPIEWYIESVKENVSEEIWQMLCSWQYREPSVYSIESQINKNTFKLRDVYGHDEYEAIMNENHLPQSNSLLLGTLIFNGNHHEFYISFIEISESRKSRFLEEINNLSEGSSLKDHFPAILQLALSEHPRNNHSEAENIDDSVLALLKKEAGEEIAAKAEILWNSYYQNRKPVIRKAEIFASALHYLVAKDIFREKPTQVSIAKRYHTTASSLSSRYRELKEFLPAK